MMVLSSEEKRLFNGRSADWEFMFFPFVYEKDFVRKTFVLVD